MNPVQWIQSKVWQLGAGAAVVALVTVSGLLIAAQVENGRVTELNSALDKRITDPKDGYVVRLAQSETNAKTVTAALTNQVKELRTKAAADAARLAETERKLAIAQVQSRTARKQASDLLAHPPTGDTLEQRVLDADAKILETLQ